METTKSREAQVWDEAFYKNSFTPDLLHNPARKAHYYLNKQQPHKALKILKNCTQTPAIGIKLLALFELKHYEAVQINTEVGRTAEERCYMAHARSMAHQDPLEAYGQLCIAIHEAQQAGMHNKAALLQLEKQRQRLATGSASSKLAQAANQIIKNNPRAAEWGARVTQETLMSEGKYESAKDVNTEYASLMKALLLEPSNGTECQASEAIRLMLSNPNESTRLHLADDVRQGYADFAYHASLWKVGRVNLLARRMEGKAYQRPDIALLHAFIAYAVARTSIQPFKFSTDDLKAKFHAVEYHQDIIMLLRRIMPYETKRALHAMSFRARLIPVIKQGVMQYQGIDIPVNPSVTKALQEGYYDDLHRQTKKRFNEFLKRYKLTIDDLTIE